MILALSLHSTYPGRLGGCTGDSLHSRDPARLDKGRGTRLGWRSKSWIHSTWCNVHYLLNTNISLLAFCVHGKVHIYLNGRQDRDRSHSDLPIPLRWSSSTPAWWHWWPGRYRRKRCHRGSGSTLSSHPSPLEQLQHEEGLVWISSDFTGLQTALGLIQFNLFSSITTNHLKILYKVKTLKCKAQIPFLFDLNSSYRYRIWWFMSSEEIRADLRSQ